MKQKFLLFSFTFICSAFTLPSVYGQCTALTPSASNTTVNCGSSATLTASGAVGYQWWDSLTGGTLLGSTATFTTPPLSTSTSYFVNGTDSSPETMMPLPAQTSTFSGNVRGYYFTAPIDFVITGLKEPVDVSGNQSIAVVKFSATPPTYSATTNAFTLLYLTQNNPSTSIIPVSIPVTAGDIIGILGQAGTTNSYAAAAPYATTIGGQPATLNRLGMQFSLTTTAPQDLWTEAAANISRVEMYYTVPCSSSRVQVDVTVAPLPVAATAQNASICNGSSTTLDATGATNYTWMPGSLTGASVTVNPTTTTTYTVTGDDGGICSNTATVTVTVNNNPVVVANATSTTICNGDAVTLTGSGASTYSWDNSVTDGVAFNPGSSTMYTVTGTDVNGCTGMDMITVNVNPLPTVVANSTASTVCEGTAVTLTGSGAQTYTWDNSVTDGVAFNPTATTTYMVTGTDANGCMNTDMTTVTVNALPTVALGADVTLCGGTVTLDAGNAGSTFAWSDSTVTQTNTISTSGIYSVVVTDANGCMGSDTVSVTINAIPTVTATAANNTVCFDDASVALNGTPANGTWSGAGVSGSSFDPSVAGNGSHTCTYTYTDINGCMNTATATITVNACTGVIENSLANGISVYPNPNSGSFTLNVNVNVGEMGIEILDVEGRTVYSSMESGVNAGYSKQISLVDFANGVYMLHLNTATEQQVIKIVMQK